MSVDLEECVIKGIELLDGFKANWRESINWDELNMGDGRECILGQLFASEVNPGSWISGFHRGTEILNLRGCYCCSPSEEEMGAAWECGFNTPEGDYTFDELTVLWLELAMPDRV